MVMYDHEGANGLKERQHGITFLVCQSTPLQLRIYRDLRKADLRSS
jgi:hypothetical protein